MTPLEVTNEEDDEEINNTTRKESDIQEQKQGNKWTRRLEIRRERRKEHQIIFDSGATSHFISDDINSPNMGQSNEKVYLPDGSTLTTKHKTLLPFNQLTTTAREASVLPGLKKSLASVSKWADEGYTTIFHPGENGVTVHRPGTLTLMFAEPPVLQGYKRCGAKLWTATLEGSKNEVSEQIHNVFNLPSTAEAIKFLHAAAGYPVKDTWIAAINSGNYITWPGLTAKLVRRHFPESDETQKGHMKQQRQNVRSTKIKIENENQTQLTPEKRMKDVYLKVHNANDTMHSDQTGRFPATSSSGNQYIMVLVEVDGNYIDAEPMKNRTAGSMVKTYHTLWKRLTEKGTIKPATHILDNEASKELKDEIRKNCDIQLVPPDNHRRNLAERAIQTFKCHFKAVLAGVDDSFPMRLWDKLLPQTVLTLNLLRQSNAAPTVSAYQYVRGSFDYNKMPLAPMGCAVQIYESRERRGTWAEHTTDGWYLETSKEHYRCHKVHVKRTNSERVTDTVFFKHRYITQPSVTSADILKKAMDDLAAALKNQRNTEGIKEMEALRKIDEL